MVPDPTVSRSHAELVRTADGRFYLTDCGSTFGTHTSAGDSWETLRQGFVEQEAPLRLGEFVTSIDELLRLLPDEDSGRRMVAVEGEIEEQRFSQDTALVGRNVVLEPARDASLPRGPVERDPETGEIIRKDR